MKKLALAALVVLCAALLSLWISSRGSLSPATADRGSTTVAADARKPEPGPARSPAAGAAGEARVALGETGTPPRTPPSLEPRASLSGLLLHADRGL